MNWYKHARTADTAKYGMMNRLQFSPSLLSPSPSLEKLGLYNIMTVGPFLEEEFINGIFHFIFIKQNVSAN